VIRPLWAARATWVAAGAAGWFAANAALAGRATAAATIATIGLWGLWAVVVVGLIVPSTAGLTVVRAAAPLAVAAGAVLWAFGAGALRGGMACGAAALFTVITFSADLGQAFVQASAYGDEQRFPLRPPVAMFPPVIVSWSVWAAAIVASSVLLAAQRWFVGGALALSSIGLSALLLPRFHQLSRRWLVLVPAGLVVHDPVVLADTAMVTRPNVAGVRLASDGSDAADFTGPAAGHVVEVSLREMATVVLAATRAKPTGTALHVQSFLVAPSRPGRVLAAATASRLTVG
jgi:hypothetical protein